MIQNKISRRKFIKGAAALSAFSIVPRFVLGGRGYLPPSETINLGFIGTGRQSVGLMKNFLGTGEVQVLAACDVYGIKLQNFITQMKAFCNEKENEAKV